MTALDDSSLARYMSRLDYGFMIAFAISGFLLYRPFVKARVIGGRPMNVGAYAWRRILRLVPAYWFALTLTGYLIAKTAVFGSLGILYYGFLQTYNPKTVLGGIPGAWSLCVEMGFYIFLPVWALVMARLPLRTPVAKLRAEVIGVALLFGFSAFWKFVVIGSQLAIDSKPVSASVYAMPRYLDQFALGMLLAVASVWLQDRPLPRLLRPIDRFPSISIVIYLAIIWFTGTQIGVTGRLGEHFSTAQVLARHYLFGLLAVAVLAPAAIGNQRRGVLRRLMARKTPLWVGSLAYGVFLYHLLWISLVDNWDWAEDAARATGAPLVLIYLLIVVGLTFVTAAISWYFFEEPIMRLRRLEPGVRPRRTSYDRLGMIVIACAAAALLAAVAGGSSFSMVDGLLVAIGVAALALVAPSLLGRRVVFPSRAPIAATVLGTLGARILLFELITASNTVPSARAAGEVPAASGVTYVVGTYDGAVLRLYANGKLVGHRRAGGAADQVSSPVEIGSFVGQGVWDGVIDDVAVYRVALAPSVIAQHFSAGLGRGSTRYRDTVLAANGLAAYWRLGDAPRSRMRDEVGRSEAVYQGGSANRAAAPSLLAGDHDGALRLNGGRGHVSVPATPALDLGRRFSLEAWVKADAADNRHIVARAASYFLKSDLGGRWSAGFVSRGQTISARSVASAPPLAGPALASGTRAPRVLTRPRGPRPQMYVSLLALVVMASGAIVSLRAQHLAVRARAS